jgi:hypothetical protein
MELASWLHLITGIFMCGMHGWGFSQRTSSAPQSEISVPVPLPHHMYRGAGYMAQDKNFSCGCLQNTALIYTFHPTLFALHLPELLWTPLTGFMVLAGSTVTLPDSIAHYTVFIRIAYTVGYQCDLSGDF